MEQPPRLTVDFNCVQRDIRKKTQKSSLWLLAPLRTLSNWRFIYKLIHLFIHSSNLMIFQLDFTGERLKVLQSNAESNHTEVDLLRDKNTKFIASVARHQETILKLQEVYSSVSSQT